MSLLILTVFSGDNVAHQPLVNYLRKMFVIENACNA